MAAYLRRVSCIPELAPAEEAELFQRLREGDRAARQVLIRGHLHLVPRVARRYEGRGVPIMDLIQEGSSGLMQAIDRYDPALGKAFRTWALVRIRGQMITALRRQGAAIDPVALGDEESEALAAPDRQPDMGEALVRVLGQLDAGARRVLEYRHGLIDGVERTQQEVADLLGYSQVRIHHIEQQALQKLRQNTAVQEFGHEWEIE